MASIYKKLKNDAWAIKTDDEKLEILKSIEKDISKKEDRAERGIAIENRPGLLGFYNEDKDKLVISKMALSSAGLSICTVLHEGRHAYQADVIKSKIVNKNQISWAKNWNGYLNPNAPGISQMDYYLQPMEQDAWSFSLKNLEKIAKKTKDVYIKNDLTDLKLTLEAQNIKAHRLYGRNFAQVLQAKIDLAFVQESGVNRNSYSNISEQLSKEGLQSDKANPDYIIPMAQVEKINNVKSKEEEARAAALKKEKEAKIKAVAEKYGFSEQASENAIKRINEVKKTQEKTETPKSNASTKGQTEDKKPTAKEPKPKGTATAETTVKITVKKSGQQHK